MASRTEPRLTPSISYKLPFGRQQVAGLQLFRNVPLQLLGNSLVNFVSGDCLEADSRWCLRGSHGIGLMTNQCLLLGHMPQGHRSRPDVIRANAALGFGIKNPEQLQDRPRARAVACIL